MILKTKNTYLDTSKFVLIEYINNDNKNPRLLCYYDHHKSDGCGYVHDYEVVYDTEMIELFRNTNIG